MSVAKKNRPHAYPINKMTDRQETLRGAKIEAERLREKLQNSIIDNPKLSKKAAILIALWISDNTQKSKR